MALARPPESTHSVHDPSRPVTSGRLAPGVLVTDLGRSVAFYAGMLGFEKVFENGDPGGFVVLTKDAAERHLSRVREHRPSTQNVGENP